MRQGVVGTVLAIFVIAGCGGGDDASTPVPSEPDGAALTAPFNALAEQAYEDAGKNRDRDFTGGTTVDGCFAADDEAAKAIGDAAGFAVTFVKENYIQGPPDQQERLLCSVNAPAGEDHPIIASVVAGTTTLTKAQTFQNLQRIEGTTKTIDGAADGLDPGSVLAVDVGGVSQYMWIDGDFTVGLSGLTDRLSPEQGFAALSAAVQGVSRTLGE